jgi:hypothetical protein
VDRKGSVVGWHDDNLGERVVGVIEHAPCCFKVCLHAEKRETIVLKEGRTESDVNVKV